MMTKWRLALALFCLVFALPLRAFDWEQVTANGREYVTLRSFCAFYSFGYLVPGGNDRFTSHDTAGHSISFKAGSSDAYLDGVHYVLSFPVESGGGDWLVSKMDVIKLFEPLLRPEEVSGRHTIRGVVIDAGHGGTDNGATSRLGNEKTYTLDTAYRLAQILNNAGLKTAFTRRTDVFVDLYERAHIASNYPDYCFVSIHFNSAEAEARGLETYCLSPRGAASTSSRYLTRGDIQKLPGNDYDPQNILLASMVHSEIIRLNPGDATADRGVKRARFVVIKMNVLPAILVEGGFVSNHIEAARVNRPDYRQALAQAIARGVIRFVNAMGDRHMALPSEMPAGNISSQPPRAQPVTPTAPSGLAHDPANGNYPPSSNSTTSSTHKKKKKTTVASQGPPSPETPSGPVAPAPETSPAPETVAHTSEGSKGGGGALNLAEPTTPTPSPDADKAPPEPDEPPTANSTSDTSSHHSGTSTTTPPEQ
jgi:N-acetylmuramoyl-L-alanine amidase